MHKIGIFRKMAVIVDGKLITSLKVGETKEIEVKNENFFIWVKMDWCRSEKIRLSNGKVNVSLICGEETFLWALFASIFYPLKAFSLRQYA